ncbi:Ribosome-releasing factor 2, mitochondrial [Tulasnella sp. 424]|nr:Ribosome-releasing factor 2, mitochondrial [Tulasnella sp. 424]
MAHIDSGKTTLTESILHTSSYLVAPGSVDTGSTTTDFLPAERERGITIQSASIPVKWKDWTFNLIDTPGHVDFGMEVESASRVVDGAVVLLDAVEGVEGQTKGVWRQLDRHSVPTRMIFLNKLDRPGASVHNSISSILNHRLHPNPLVLTLPIASFDSSRYKTGEPGLEGIVDLVNWEIWRWHASRESTHAPAEKVERIPLPRTEEELKASQLFNTDHPIIPEILEARQGLIDNLSVLSPELMETFVELPETPSPYLTLTTQALMSSLRQLTLDRAILPIICGAALKHVGTDILMDFVGELLASPIDVAKTSSSTAIGSKKKTAIKRPDQLQMLAWKVSWDKRKGWMTFVRVYSGTLQGQSGLLNTTSGQRERASKVMLLYASQPEEVQSLSFGSVGVVLGLKHTRTGDTLTSLNAGSSDATLRSIVPPPAVISASVVPHSQADVQPVQEALAALSRTDPSVRVTEDAEEGQTLVHGLGALHLEIVEGRLRDEWGVKVQFGKRRVSYRENFGYEGEEGVETRSRWERDVGGKRVGATVEMKVSALVGDASRSEELNKQAIDSWGGSLVSISETAGDELEAFPSPESTSFNHTLYPSTSPITAVLQGVLGALSSSPHTMLPLSHLNISITSFELDQGSPPTTLTAAATDALRQALFKAGPGQVMEPYINVKIDVGEEGVGKVVRDLTENGGEILDLAEGSNSATAGGEEEGIGPYSSEGIYLPPKWVTPSSASLEAKSGGASFKRSVRAVAPLGKMLDYSSRLRAVSGGQATFEMSVEGFRPVGDMRRLEILKEMGRA